MANDRLVPPRIKPDGRFSRIRLSEGHSLAALLRHRSGPRRPRGQPLQAVAFPENFRWIRLPQGLLTSVLAPYPALQPIGRILVEPVKDPRAVGVVETAARLSVISFEVHSMGFTVVATGQFSLDRALAWRLAACSPTQLSVVNSPIRPAGLPPAWHPDSPAHTRKTKLDAMCDGR